MGCLLVNDLTGLWLIDYFSEVENLVLRMVLGCDGIVTISVLENVMDGKDGWVGQANTSRNESDCFCMRKPDIIAVFLFLCWRLHWMTRVLRLIGRIHLGMRSTGSAH